MFNPMKKLLGTFVLAAACVVAPQAAAQFAVQIQGQQCVDNAACDANANVGIINFTGNNGVAATVAIGTTNSPGGPAFSLIDMAWVVFNTGPATALDFLISATGFTFPAAGVPSILDSQLNGNAGGAGATVTGQSWLDFSNTLFGEQGLTTGPQALNTQAQLAFVSQGTYSLTQHLFINIGQGAISTGDFLTQVVPEPAPLALIGIALAGLALARRRQRS